MTNQLLLLQLAQRLLFSKNNNYVLKIITWVCLIAMMFGSLALTLILAIMQGFEQTTTARLQSIYPAITIQAPFNQDLNFNKIKDYLAKQDTILAYSPTASSYGILHNPQLSTELDLHNLVLIKAIDPMHEATISDLNSKLIKLNQTDVSPNLANCLNQTSLIIGANLAQNLGLSDFTNPPQINLFLPSEPNAKRKSLNFKKIKVQVRALIRTGISDFDDSLVITSLDFAKEHWHHFGITEIGLKLLPNTNLPQTILKLKTDLKLPIITWQERYAPILAALKLEKHTGVAIAILMILIASMTLIALLFILITKQTRTIAILQILGLSKNKIKQIFVCASLIISIIATSTGLILASLISLIIQKYYIIELPQAYLITTLPIALSWQMLLYILLTVLSLTFLISLIPIQIATKLDLVQVLKNHD